MIFLRKNRFIEFCIITSTIFFFSTSSYSSTCRNSEIQKKYEIVSDNFLKESEKIHKLLVGEKVENYTIQSIFGIDFDVKKTDEYIQKQISIIQDQEGVFLENKTLSECLVQLGKNEQNKKLKELTVNLINQKIELLKRNQTLNDTLRESHITESTLPEIREKIDRDSAQARIVKENLEDSLIKKQSETFKEKSTKKREVLEYENTLTKIKIELLNLKIEINSGLEIKINQFEKSTSEIREIAKQIEDKDTKALIQNFEEIEKIWLSLASEDYFNLFSANISLKLPQIPESLNQDKFKDDISDSIKLRDEIILLRKEIIKNYSDKINQELRLLNHLVASSNSIRENIFRKLGSSFFFKSLLKFQSYKMIKNEVSSAPYRAVSFIYSKYLAFREQLSLGKEGILTLMTKLFSLIILAISFFSLRYLFNKTNENVDKIFKYLFERKIRSFIIRKLFIIWNKIKDSTVPILWLIVLAIYQKYRPDNGLSLIIRALEVYLVSIILKSMLTIFLGTISRLDIANFSKFKIKANETSNKFKNIFLFYFFTMIIIEATIGKVYLYTILNYFVLIYSLFLFFNETSHWENEFRKYSEKMFSGIIVEKYFRFLDLCPSKLRASFLFVFIILLIFFDIIIGLTENFEISKKISANLFKKQIEKIEAEDGADDKIPSSYKEQFSFKSISSEDEYVTNGQGLEEKIILEIDEWLDDRSDEHSLVVYGDKGIGKTTLLKKVGSTLEKSDRLNVKYTKMPAKTVSLEAMNSFLYSIFFNEATTQSLHLYEFDQKLEKNTVVIIDECQNLFLSHTGGFEAYYLLINLINLNTEKIFWIMSFNKYSWLYLDRAFGRNQFFRNVFELQGWSDSAIKDLIMKRHVKTGVKLSFDLLISATRSQDEIDKYSSIESKFFKLLWELSRGNPRAALYLWMSALSRKSKNVFNVYIPKESGLDGIEKMPDELMFVIAHVLKHENLSSSEIEMTTNLQKGLVRNAIKLALEKKFFFKDERGRYMVDISTQYGLTKYLRVKNFIYGN
ncbi:MAG: AAA family ATPase [Halobacteriovoraceae bacterium]|nr:AAA family ATPase [Halobacteriovoraceae bacterium]